MGQQQLLLLVLSTVIVGLATVAGIQAFDENRQQAAADALTQKGTSLAADVKGLVAKPAQFGGLDTTSTSKSEVASKLGIDGGATVPGAGDGTCSVSSVSGGGGSSNFKVTINCKGAGDYSNLEFNATFQTGTSGVQVKPVVN
ncbi:MAG: hypothetical protein ABEL51_07745 [Salinibacter sp.]